MGCDIHMYVEYKLGSKWHNGDYFRMNPNWKGADSVSESQYTRVEIYPYRDYALFSVLANVRNGYPGYQCIDQPRDLPDNVTDFVKAEYESWGWDAHSASYLTLQELIDFHEKYHPVYDLPLSGYILENLIEKLKERANDINLIYDFYWNSDREESRREAYRKSKNIRIVFWFDN